MLDVVRIATRQSRLALWQTNMVAQRLCQANPGLVVELLPTKTEGDRRLDDSLAKYGGKGLFIKELEIAMLEERADIAVHSMKDVPVDMPDGFVIAAVLNREDPRDALISRTGKPLAELDQRARVGTSSLRRQAQLLSYRGDFDIRPLRGNIGTRLRKLDDGDYDAIVLATAGLNRLGLAERISEHLDVNVSLPAAAQGAVGIECRADDVDLRRQLAALDDEHCRNALTAERAFCRALGANCTSPVAAFADRRGSDIQLVARVLSPDGANSIDDSVTFHADVALQASEKLAASFLDRGALELMGGSQS